MIKLSVVVITFNEEKNILRCLQSVKNVADEIIVLDSQSTDQTVSLARQLGAVVHTRAFTGYVDQKNAAAALAGNEWVLSLDADEALSPELEKEILRVKENPGAVAYRLNRLTNYCGKWIRHCGWYPDRVTRLFNRAKGKWEGLLIHEKWESAEKGSKPADLQGDLYHYSYYTFSDHIRKIQLFSEIMAKEAVMKGKNCSLFKLWFGPKWNFFNDYILKAGFLDGYYGYMVCKYSSWAAFSKYSKIRQYNRLKEEAHLQKNEG
ncbi:MAG TPA: glycosyltransferase family 2 protein [Chitinophagaceae bacterium]|nr:glycosyltransferase family 2 protein [Chitinophagaceae bacterium]